MKYSSAFYMLMAYMLVTPAWAQAPVPPQNAASVAGAVAPSANVPDFDADNSSGNGQTYIDDNGVEQKKSYAVELTPSALAETEQLRQETRLSEVAAGGFAWMPWSKAGKNVWEFVYKRDPKMKKEIEQSGGKFLDIAVTDLDRDGQPDIVLWYWDDCGSDGCLFTIYFGKEVKQPENYIARIVRPYEQGIMVDDGYFKL